MSERVMVQGYAAGLPRPTVGAAGKVWRIGCSGTPGGVFGEMLA